MAGLAKGRPAASRNLRNPSSNNNFIGGGAVYGGNRNGSLFISSYCDDKKQKYQQQSREKTKRWLTRGSLALALTITAVVVGSQLPKSSRRNEIRSESSSSEITPEGDGNAHPPHEAEKVRHSAVDDGAKKVHVSKGADDFVCGRRIPFSLADPSRWPTEFTMILKPKRQRGAKEVMLLGKDARFDDLGSQLSSFFRAYDFAHDEEIPLYVAQNSWVFETLFPLFMGPSAAVEQNSKLWGTIEEALGVRVVENEGVLRLMGVNVVADRKSPRELLDYASKELDATTIRNHRNTVLRKLFRYPSHLGVESVCSAFESLHGGSEGKKYTAIHVAPGDRGASYNFMDSKYAEAILAPLDMLKHNVYLIDGSDSGDPDAHMEFINAATSTQLNIVDLPQQFKHIGSHVYLAVLADVYLGDPTDPTSLWIARMRYALGMQNTFIFMERERGQWVSFMDDEIYLDLYDIDKLGIHLMG